MDDGQVIATLLNYATHPVVLGERNLSFSADYPGYATAAVEQAVGGVAMFVLGSAGDVDPVVYRDHGRHAGTFEVAKQMGRRLATAAATAIDRAEPRADARISIAEQRVDVPLDPPPSKQELARLKSEFLARRGPSDVLPTTNEGMWAMFELAWAEDLERALELDSVPSALPVQMTAARIGELYAVTFPFEIYSQIGLDVRRRMEPRDVVIAGYTNGLIGYVPTDRAKDQGGYGPTYSHRFFPDLLTAVGRGADETLVTAATNLLRTLEG
jgi:neutral ceramidase